MEKIIKENYDITVKRGLITPFTKTQEFIDKLNEEVSELEDSLLGKIDFNYESQLELADVILTALNMAKHHNLDIELILKEKIEINSKRIKNK